MQLLTGNPWPDLFGQCQREAFHLEVRDSYAVPDESEPLRRFLADEPDNLEWFADWGNLMRTTADRGVKVTRVRVVTVPHTDYQRWLLALAVASIEAGEDIRYLPRHLAGTIPEDDYWLFDSERLVFNLVDENGRAAGVSAQSTDPELIDRCQTIKQHLWSLATPYAEYVAKYSVDSRQ